MEQFNEEPGVVLGPETVVELVDTTTDRGPITVKEVRVNGQEVRVARDGVVVDYGEPGVPDDGQFVKVTLELLVDRFSIHRVAQEPEPPAQPVPAQNSAEHNPFKFR